VNRWRTRARQGRRAERDARAMVDLAQRIASVRGETALMESVVEWALSAVDLVGCAVLVDGVDGALEARTRAGAVPEGLAGPFDAAGAAGILSNTREFRAGRGAWAGLYVPFSASGERAGVLWMRERTPGARDGCPDLLLSWLAGTVGTAIERERLRAMSGDVETLRFTDDLKSFLLAVVSHELRTPLAVIEAASTGLLQDGVELERDVVGMMAETIHREARHLDELVSDLLDLSRVDAGALSLNLGWYDVGEAVREVTSNLSGVAGGAIQVEAEEGLPPTRLDYVLFERVLVNLVENARRYAPMSSPVRICVRTGGPDTLLITVIDRGSGIPEHELERIFDRFHRVDTAGRGTGLGLALCRAIVDAHGGRIWAESPVFEGRGTAFHFTLPLVDAEDPSLEEPALTE
jgi:two-component system sensor histidine kinase KdpD